MALSVFYLSGIVGAYLVFTLRPPREPDMFIDPITGRYGVEAHPELGPEPGPDMQG